MVTDSKRRGDKLRNKWQTILKYAANIYCLSISGRALGVDLVRSLEPVAHGKESTKKEWNLSWETYLISHSIHHHNPELF